MLAHSAVNNGNKPYLRPKMASEFLSELGIGAAPATLAKYRVTGEGPIFHKIGRQVVYAPVELVNWAEQRISPPKSSTSAA